MYKTKIRVPKTKIWVSRLGSASWRPGCRSQGLGSRSHGPDSLSNRSKYGFQEARIESWSQRLRFGPFCLDLRLSGRILVKVGPEGDKAVGMRKGGHTYVQRDSPQFYRISLPSIQGSSPKTTLQHHPGFQFYAFL